MKVTFNTTLTMDELAERLAEIGGELCPGYIGIENDACDRGERMTLCKDCRKMVLTEVK